MRDEERTRPELIAELVQLRRRIDELGVWKKGRQLVMEQLKLSEAKFRALTENSAFGMFMIQDGALKYANPKMAAVFGYDRAELIDSTEMKALVFHKDWPTVEREFVKRVVEDVESTSFRFRGIKKNGEIIYCAAHGSRADYKNRPAGICSLLDVTPLIQAQEGLENELKKFRVLYDLAVAMTADRSLEHSLSLVVEKSRSLFGTDTAFLALTDEQTGDVVMHTMSGIKTRAFRNLRLSFERGLGGKMAATGKGYICNHLIEAIEPSLQGIAGEEGLDSGIAVPIQIGQKNLGVLSVFNRRTTSFTKSDLDTLSLLGNMAAVEITRNRADKASRESEERYRSVMEAVPDPIAVYIGGKVTYVNPAFTRVFGWTLDELTGTNSEYFTGDQLGGSGHAFDRMIPADGFYGFETRRKNKAGALIDINVSAALLRGSDGNIIGSVIALQDITERKRAAQELERYKEQLEDLVKQRTDEAAKLAEANKKLSISVKEQEQRALELTQLHHMGELLQACRTEQETYKIVGSTCSLMFPEDSGFLSILDDSRTSLLVVTSWGNPGQDASELSFDNCWALRLGKMHCVANPEVELVCPHVTSTGDFMSICTPVAAQGEVLGMLHVRWEIKDTEEENHAGRRKMESRRMLVIRLVEHYALSLVNLRLRQTLTRQSIRDPLTGLFNRRYMEESLEREVRRAERRGTSLGIIMLDVDHFKNFNDQYGHETGDILLRRLGVFLRRSVRGEDIACRYGGEEFALILPDASLDQVARRADSIREGAKQELRINQRGDVVGVTVSLGVAAFPKHGPTAEDALHAADTALYRAKAEGRDRVVKAD